MKLYLILISLLITNSAVADDSKIKTGLQTDVGLPDGVAIGITVQPGLSWVRMTGSVTYNSISPGFRFGTTIEPFHLFVSPSFTLEGGWASISKIPYLENSPEIGYMYLNIHVGIEVGKPDNWKLFLHAGPTWLNGSGQDITSSISERARNIQAESVSLNGWVLPTGKIGFVKFF